jgi:hypothetical protein
VHTQTLTRFALHPGKSSAEQSAIEQALELFLHIDRIPMARLRLQTRLLQYRLNVLAHHLMQHPLFRLPAHIGTCWLRCSGRCRKRGGTNSANTVPLHYSLISGCYPSAPAFRPATGPMRTVSGRHLASSASKAGRRLEHVKEKERPDPALRA